MEVCKAKQRKTKQLTFICHGMSEIQTQVMTLAAFLHVQHCICNTYSTVHLHGIVFGTILNGFREILIKFIQFFVVNDIFHRLRLMFLH